MFPKKLILKTIIILFIISFKMMAQNDLVIKDQTINKNVITIASESEKPAATLLKKYLDKSFKSAFIIQNTFNQDSENTTIHLEIKALEDNTTFIIKSDTRDIFLIAPNAKLLRYAVYTLLEKWGFRKFTAQETYIPKLNLVKFPKNNEEINKPSFEYRALLYPDAYDEDFRDWHKLDWHIDDFSVWGHSFNMLLSAKEYFKTNPDFFALYEGNRNTESLCMTNDTVVDLVIKKMTQVISEHPNAQFYSVSQNDDVVYCECTKCSTINHKHGGPQGSLYYFLNKIAVHFPKTKITTLAYLHTFKPPTNLKIQPNIYTLLCPIELNRGKAIADDNYSKPFRKNIQDWNAVTSNLYLWDYTVQFSNYMSPFPNINTLSDNYKFFKKNNIKGLFVQGYADVPGDLSELRQYLLAKLLWNTEIDIDATTDDFLRGFYGKAAPNVRKYLNLLTENQQKSNAYLDIYSGPVQSRNTFLTPEAMDQYDTIIDAAEIAVADDSILASRVQKIRLTLEYAFFEQSKFYGQDKHGMFIVNQNGTKELKKGLNERVLNFTKKCTELGIYELSESGTTPENYYKEWLEISNNITRHLGENLKVNFLTQPAEDFIGKGSYGLVDGTRGYKDFNINWIGWYGNNPEIEIETNNTVFNQIKMNFLDDQRHWIFLPKKITVYGFKNNKWTFINSKTIGDLTENYEVNMLNTELNNSKFSIFAKIKIIIENHEDLPIWRKRKHKKPMVMIDEIELYNKTEIIK
ncbi:hypothetical protein HNP99_001980 [Flavobacterium sp. 28A]|uniref:DUF4838 domain-containing protein n=1 Tax=Flavobacterium sp. 28A TaxID=2735895 RepID=UPI001E14EC87|nr:DUF4838 domain-containing protein [Flavobacterium sp. 28A]NRT15623.1 hypothetical protein [Flavobacterium sp. 28A]